jgi:hypothetical protein
MFFKNLNISDFISLKMPRRKQKKNQFHQSTTTFSKHHHPETFLWTFSN